MGQSRFKILFAATAVMAAVTVAAPADAAPITIAFTASVQTSDLPGAVLNDPVSGTFTFESTAPDSDPSASVGLYENAISQFSVSAGIYSGSLTTNFVPGIHGVFVENNDGGDTYFAFAQTDPATPLDSPGGTGLGLLNVSLQMIDLTELALDSDALPLTPPDVSQFSFRFVTLTFHPLDDIGPNRQITAFINSMTLVGVPAPAAMGLLAFGLAGLAGARTRYRVVGR